MDRQKQPPILSNKRDSASLSSTSDLPMRTSLLTPTTQDTQTSEQRQLTLFPLPEKEIKKSKKRLKRKSTTKKKDEICVQLTLLPV
jgi:hypothetical protein